MHEDTELITPIGIIVRSFPVASSPGPLTSSHVDLTLYTEKKQKVTCVKLSHHGVAHAAMHQQTFKLQYSFEKRVVSTVLPQLNAWAFISIYNDVL